MTFGTAINCMDGRTQKPIIEYLTKKFNVNYIDIISEPGPNLILSEQNNKELLKSIFAKINISIERHGSENIAIIGHYDCAGNPSPKVNQLLHIKEAVKFIQLQYPNINVIGLWVNKNWMVEEV